MNLTARMATPDLTGAASHRYRAWSTQKWIRAFVLCLASIVSSLGLVPGQSNYVDLKDFATTTIGGQTSGAFPNDIVVMDAQGNLWGTTGDGGANGEGMLWEIPSGGVWTDVHDFDFSTTDCSYPSGPLVFDAAGNVYGVASFGSGNEPNGGGVWEYSPGSGLRILANLSEGTLSEPRSLTIDNQGNIWGIAESGGAHGQGGIWEISNGQYSEPYSFTGGTDGGGPLAIATDGTNLFGTTTFIKHTSKLGTIWKFSASTLTTLYSFTSADEYPFSYGIGIKGLDLYGTTLTEVWHYNLTSGFNVVATLPTGDFNATGYPDSYSTVAIDNANNLYGVTQVQGAYGPGYLWEVSATTGIVTDLHDFGSGSDGMSPRGGVCLDEYGNIYGDSYQGGANNAGMVFKYFAPLGLHVASSVSGGLTASGAATMYAAPVGGAIVSLSSSNPSIASVPSSITIPAGGSFGPFSIATSAVASNTVVTITATYGTLTNTSQITVKPAELESVTISPASMLGGAGAMGTLTLNTPAAANMSVTLTSANPSAVSVPTSVTIQTGQSQATFSITTSAVSSNTSVKISAGLNGVIRTTGLTLEPNTLTSITRSPATLLCGQAAVGTVTLTGPAPTGGISVTLSPTVGAAYTTGSVIVPAGSSYATFPIYTSTVGSNTSATISASLGAVTESIGITVEPLSLVSITRTPASLLCGASAVGTVTLNSPAPTGGIQVTLGPTSGPAYCPPTVTVPAGATSVSYSITTTAVTSDTSVSLTATLNGLTRSIAITIEPPALTYVTLSPSTVTGGTSSTGTAGIATALPFDLAIPLSSNSASATVASTVTIHAGSTSAKFTVTTSTVATSETATITATLGTTKSATLTINP